MIAGGVVSVTSIFTVQSRFSVFLLSWQQSTIQLDPGNKEAVRAARRIKDKVAQAAKEDSPIRQVGCITHVILAPLWAY